MKTATLPADSSTAIWERLVEFQGPLSPTAARALLKLQFSESDQALMEELSKKARAGALTTQEQSDLDTFERLCSLLGILHSKARQALKKKPKKAS
jgi:hypothetical protein